VSVHAAATEFAPGLWVRGIAPPLALADFRVIAFDMDSTLIDIECIDEIAAAAGRGREVAAITEAAMRGELADFKASLRARLALLEGVPEAVLAEVYEQRLHLNPGVERFVAACRDAGLATLLVSGGFSFFAERVQARLGLDHARSNVLEIIGGRMTGRTIDQPWGDIVDGAAKRQALLEICAQTRTEPARAIAVGDGANDLPMMAAAGLSIAYHPKPAVQAQARVSILAGGMDRALDVFDAGALRTIPSAV